MLTEAIIQLDTIKEILAAEMRRMRVNENLTQRQVADMLLMTEGNYRDYEGGKKRNPYNYVAMLDRMQNILEAKTQH